MITNKLRNYFHQGTPQPYAFRIASLNALRSAIINNRSAIHTALITDLGKPAHEIEQSEINFCLHEIDLHIRCLKDWIQPHKVTTPWFFWPTYSYQIAHPYGVVLIISPWNFPFQLSIVPLIGALSAGNCAIIKPSELAPTSSQLLYHMCQTIFDTQHVQVVLGDKTIAEELLKEPFDYIFFTGNSGVGKKVMAAAAHHLTPCTLELGGSNPCIVDQTTDIYTSAKRIMWAKLYNAGQSCVAPNIILVHESVQAAFINACINYLNEYQLTAYSSIITSQHFERLCSIEAKATIIYSGPHDPIKRKFHPLIIELSLDDPLTHKEFFGPIIPIITYSNLTTTINNLARRPKPLALYIFSRDEELHKTVVKSVHAGTVCINDCIVQVANHYLPFGGVGSSGFGAYHGKATFDTFSHSVSIMKRTFWSLPFKR